MSQSLFSSRCKKGFKKFEILKNSNLSLCLLFLDHFFAHKLQTDEPLLSGGLGRMWRIDGGIRTDDFLYNVYLLFVLLYIFEWDLCWSFFESFLFTKVVFSRRCFVGCRRLAVSRCREPAWKNTFKLKLCCCLRILLATAKVQ